LPELHLQIGPRSRTLRGPVERRSTGSEGACVGMSLERHQVCAFSRWKQIVVAGDHIYTVGSRRLITAVVGSKVPASDTDIG